MRVLTRRVAGTLPVTVVLGEGRATRAVAAVDVIVIGATGGARVQDSRTPWQRPGTREDGQKREGGMRWQQKQPEALHVSCRWDTDTRVCFCDKKGRSRKPRNHENHESHEGHENHANNRLQSVSPAWGPHLMALVSVEVQASGWA